MRGTALLLLASRAAGTYPNNFALQFGGGQYVRVPHDTTMNAPLIDSWSVEAWVLLDPGAQQLSGAGVLNVVGFPSRHPSLGVTRTGHAHTAVRDAQGTYFGYEGTTQLADGQWHHLAATWEGRTAPEARELALYVDGVLEPAGGPQDDGSGVPKHPGRPTTSHPQGYVAASRCNEGLCEEGMQIGGYCQPGGGGYTGAFFNGAIDEVRLRTRPHAPRRHHAGSGFDSGCLAGARVDAAAHGE